MGLEGKQPLVSCKPSVARISSSNIAANRQRLENTVEDFHHEEKCINDRLATAALSLAFSGSANAGPGIVLQGIKLNGWSLNGWHVNGVRLKAVVLPGTSMQATKLQGMELQSLKVEGGQLVGVTRVAAE
jgi:hypothetical protein